MPSRISWVAGGNISPSRFVKAYLANPFYCIQAVDGLSMPVGISQEGTRNAGGTAADDGYAAISGTQLTVYDNPNDDEPLLMTGAAVTAGQLLMPDSAGKGVPVTTGKYYGAMALQGATATDILIRVRPLFGGLD